MKRFTIYLLLAILTSGVAKSQDNAIRFTIQTNKIVAAPVKPSAFKYDVPLTLSFGREFKDKKISFYNDPGATDLVAEAIFETDIGRSVESGDYVIPLGDGILDIKDNTVRLKGDVFFFKVTGLPLKGPFNVKKIVVNGEVVTVTDGGTPRPPIPVTVDYVPGYIIYDAVELLRLKPVMNSTGLQQVKHILGAYGITKSTDFNSFLKTELGSFSFAGIQSSGGVFSSIISGVGNWNVGNFADGLAKFLVARSKEELNVTFFEKFQEFVKKYPEVTTLFPTTASFLGTIHSYNYAAMLPALRSAFERDMNEFSARLLELRNLTTANCNGDANCQTRIANLQSFLKTPAGRAVTAAILITDDVLKGNNPAEILDNIAGDQICQQGDNFSGIVQFANLLSTSLRSKEDSRVWVSKSQLTGLLTNESLLRIYIGLMVAKATKSVADGGQPIKFAFSDGSSLQLTKFFEDLDTKWTASKDNFKLIIRQLGTLTADISDLGQNITKQIKDGQQGSFLIYANYTRGIANFLNESFIFLSKFEKINAHLPEIKNAVASFTNVINPALDACYDIKSQNYGSLVLHSSQLLAALLNNDYTFRDEYIKYGTFMASIAEAKNSDEVKSAFEAAVLPVGSASVKRQTTRNISLNAFIGPAAGVEVIPQLEEKKAGFVVGLTAPVGVAFSWGKKGKKKGGSESLFISLIDVGALAMFRLADDKTEVASEVKLKNIVAPGAYFYWGLAKTPLSIGLGGQLGPQLRKVTVTGLDQAKNYYFRIGLNVVVDIPLFNLYTKND